MKDRPILFSAPMVRALLAGTKTQTRRVVKPQPKLIESSGRWYWEKALDVHGSPLVDASRFWWEYYGTSPYGQPGDRLWVRETCRAEELDSGLDGVRYTADNAFVPIENTFTAAERWLVMNTYRGKRNQTVPPIHMPRWASRITLEVTGVRVERLQDISETDCVFEGAVSPLHSAPELYVGEYRKLWESINGPGSWDANPWVWAITFKRVTP